MKALKISVIFVGLILQLSTTAYALTPQQYCEKLHARRPTGTTTSYEMLNIEFPTDDVTSFLYGGGAQLYCAGSPVPTPAACGTPSMLVVVPVPGDPVSYSTSITTSKFCRDGAFLYKKEVTITHIMGCSRGIGICPTPGTVCTGTGC